MRKSHDQLARISLMEKVIRELLFTGNSDLIAHTESALQWIDSHFAKAALHT